MTTQTTFYNIAINDVFIVSALVEAALRGDHITVYLADDTEVSGEARFVEDADGGVVKSLTPNTRLVFANGRRVRFGDVVGSNTR